MPNCEAASVWRRNWPPAINHASWRCDRLRRLCTYKNRTVGSTNGAVSVLATPRDRWGGRGALILGSAFGIVKTAQPDRTRQGDFRNFLRPEELVGLGAVAARIVIAGIISAGAMATGSTS